MSATAETPPPPPPPAATPAEVDAIPQTPTKLTFDDLARDIIMWRAKYLSILVLLAATATWATLQLYQFNFITVASWVVMVVLSLVFIRGNINRLLRKYKIYLLQINVS